MFDIVVQSRYRQVYAVQSLKRHRRRRTGSTLVERTKRAVVSMLPKTLIARTWYKCTSEDSDFGGLLFHSLCACRRWDRNGLSAMRLSVCSCNWKSVHLLRIYTRAEGGERIVTVVPLEPETDSLPLETSVTSHKTRNERSSLQAKCTIVRKEY
jgi:hypothetical protein